MVPSRELTVWFSVVLLVLKMPPPLYTPTRLGPDGTVGSLTSTPPHAKINLSL
jgi:hypothetical protein